MTLPNQMAQIERSKTNFRGLSLKRRLLIKGTSKQNWHLFEGLGMMIIQYFQKSTLMFNRPRLGGHDRSDKGSQADLTDLKIWCKKKGSERKSHGSWPRLALELLQRIGTNKVE